VVLPPAEGFLAERERFGLRHACEDCAHFVPEEAPSAGGCAHGYPAAAHRAVAFLRTPSQGLFCKEFELA
jgi:hypothetical protein